MSRRDVIKKIVHRENNKQRISERVVRHEDKELYEEACRLFGAWDTALQYAGIDQRKNRRKSAYEREEVIRIIRRLCITGYRLVSTRCRQRDYRLYTSARECFGSWKNAIIAAGINPRNVNKSFEDLGLNKDNVIAYLQERHRQGLSLAWNDICYENRPMANAAKRYFGKWPAALAAAGISIDEATSPKSEQTQSSPEADTEDGL